MKKYDVIIIGSGVAGLTSAALLSKFGKSVLVLEKYSKVGGYMHSFKRFGEEFDTGAHYIGSLGEGQPYNTLLRYLGVYDENLFVPLNEKGFDRFHFPEGHIDFPKGYDNVVSELLSIFPNEKDGIINYFRMIQDAVRQFPTYHFNDESLADRPLEALDVSLQAIVEKLISDSRLQSLLYAYCYHHGAEPQDVPFGFHAIVTDSLIRGSYGLTNGGDALANAYVEMIRKNGGEVLLKEGVTSLQIKDRQVESVRTETGKEFSASWVISTLHPKLTVDLCSDKSSFPPAFNQRLQNLKESSAVFALYGMADSKSLDPLRNDFFFSTSNPKALFQQHQVNEVPGMVFSASPKRSLPNKDSHPISLLSMTQYSFFESWKETKYGRRPKEYNELKTLLAQKTLELVGEYNPTMASSLNTYVSSSPLSNLHFNGSPHGSAYGLYHGFQNTGARAIGPRTKILNLLLAGQNYLFPGLLGSSISSLRTCGHILSIKPILKDLKMMRETCASM